MTQTTAATRSSRLRMSGVLIAACLSLLVGCTGGPLPQTQANTALSAQSYDASGTLLWQSKQGPGPIATRFTSAVQQADGRVVVAGGATDAAGTGYAHVLRLTAAGDPDLSLSPGGELRVPTTLLSPSVVRVWVVEGGSVLILASGQLSGPQSGLGVQLLRADLSPSTGPGWRGPEAALPGALSVTSATLMSSRAVVLVGTLQSNPGAQDSTDSFVTQLGGSGALDGSSGGLVRLNLGPDDRASAVTEDTQGRILVAGTVAIRKTADGSPRRDVYVQRLTSSGLRDYSWNASYYAHPYAAEVVVTDLEMQGTQPVLAGYLRHPSSMGDAGLLVRFTESGQLDPSFGDPGAGGWGVILPGDASTHKRLSALAVQPDLQLQVAGYTVDVSGDARSLHTRFSASGRPIGPVLTANALPATGGEVPTALLIRADNSPLLLGTVTPGVGAELGYAQVLPANDYSAPTVSLQATPLDVVTGDAVTMTATASDDQVVRRVEITRNGVRVATLTQAPWIWQDTPGSGTYEYSARAFDAVGKSGTSQNVTVSVRPASGTFMPSFSPSSVTLSPATGQVSSGSTLSVNTGGRVASVSLSWAASAPGLTFTPSGASTSNFVPVRVQASGTPPGIYRLLARVFVQTPSGTEVQTATLTVTVK